MRRVTGRELGIWLGQLPPGPHNDLTDVPGVAVGHVSLVRGHGRLIPGKGPVRTGVTAILPHGRSLYREPCRAGIEVFNGYGKSLGLQFIQETGVLNSPVLLTNTLSVYDVANGAVTYLLGNNPEIGNDARTPSVVVFECDDSYLNDIRGRHVRSSDAILALQRANRNPVEQGNVGAGVGMSCFQLKGGIGSASRVIPGNQGFVLGVLALANFGLLQDLLISGVPVGKELKLLAQGIVQGSLILVGITNAPLSSKQLDKIAKRAFLGMARTGSVSRTGSGDFCLMVSNSDAGKGDNLSDWELDGFFQASVEAGAESIWNSLFLAQTLDGRDGHIRHALPIQETLKIMRKRCNRPDTYV